jgi:hypothetical protein
MISRGAAPLVIASIAVGGRRIPGTTDKGSILVNLRLPCPDVTVGEFRGRTVAARGSAVYGKFWSEVALAGTSATDPHPSLGGRWPAHGPLSCAGTVLINGALAERVGGLMRPGRPELNSRADSGMRDGAGVEFGNQTAVVAPASGELGAVLRCG